MRPLGERRGLQPPRQAQCQLGAVAFTNGELARQVGLVVAQARVPQRDAVAPARDFRQEGAAFAGAPVPGGIRHQQVGEHLVVDVAAECDHARLVEMHGRIGLAAIERQLKALGGRERVDLVADGVAVGELDGRAHRDDEQVRCEAAIHLIHDGMYRRCVANRDIEC